MSRSTTFCRLLRRGIPANCPRHPFSCTRSSSNSIFTSQITRNYQSRDTSNEAKLDKLLGMQDRLRRELGSANPDLLRELEERFDMLQKSATKGGKDVDLIPDIEKFLETQDRAGRELGSVNPDLFRELEEMEKLVEGEKLVEEEKLAEDEDDDYMGVRELAEKYMRQRRKWKESELYMHEEPTDSDSEDEYDEAKNMRLELFNKRFDKYKELEKKFLKTATLDEAYKVMKEMDKIGEKLVPLRSEYRVIGELMNRLKVAEGKDKFLLQMKLNRAVKLVEWKEAFEPKDPINYGLIAQEQDGAAGEREEDEEEKKENKEVEGSNFNLELDDLEGKDGEFLEKIDEIDKKLEQKLAELEFTFGKKGKLLEEEIRDLAEERNMLTEQKTQPLYRKGFEVRLLDMNRTCKVTKGGQVIKYTAMLACGNYNGLVGFATARAPTVNVAIQKARAKCFENLHYIERHEDHTIAHAIQTSYKKTKIYLWPAPTRTGIKAGRTVHTILDIAGFKNLKSKVIGSRNPQNTVKALFKALNAIETPKDVEQKFGRTVVESYLI